MKLPARLSDFLIGVFVVGTVAVLVVAVIFTQGWNERRFDLYLITGSAQDLTVDTRVYLQGLEVGRLEEIAPLVGRARGQLTFLARLRIRQHYRGGDPLELPVGTTAEIRSQNALAGVSIALQVPAETRGLLRPGDTIVATRRPGALEAIAQVADSLATQLSVVLADTRRLVVAMEGTATAARGEIERTSPGVRATLADLRTALQKLSPALEQATGFMETTGGHVADLHDSLSGTLSQTRTLLAHLDAMTGENRTDVRQTVANLHALSVQLNHFADQVSRRPLRMLSGVRPLPDSLLRPTPVDSTAGSP